MLVTTKYRNTSFALLLSFYSESGHCVGNVYIWHLYTFTYLLILVVLILAVPLGIFRESSLQSRPLLPGPLVYSPWSIGAPDSSNKIFILFYIIFIIFVPPLSPYRHFSSRGQLLLRKSSF